MQNAQVQLRDRVKASGLSIFVALTVFVMIVPLPTALLDGLIAGNIALSLTMLLVALLVERPISFASLPTLLLASTLFRLALNVSATRLVLLDANAGEVIRAFGSFVVRGNYVVGGVVFSILTLIQYLVVARGAERVAEVGARFTLDAMPGKQMAIDSELRAGSLGRDEARSRRHELERESQFYGAMDGAMKFVKGDAIAGLAIIAINLIGGVAVGVGMRGLGVGEALRTYGLLTIGDGLVSQIPSLLISTAAGFVVTRVSSEERESNLGRDVVDQLFRDPQALTVGATLLLGLALVPGLPALPFAFFSLVLAVVGYRARARSVSSETSLDAPILLELPADVRDAGAQVARAREELHDASGAWLPEVGIRTNTKTAVRIHDVPVAVEEGVPLSRLLVAAARRHARDLFGIDHTERLLARVGARQPGLVAAVVPRLVGVPLLTEVLRRLLEEQVSIKSLPTILESLALLTDPAAPNSAPLLTERVRQSLQRQTSARYAPLGTLEAVLVDPTIEAELREGAARAKDERPVLSPDVVRDILHAARTALETAPSAPILTTADIRRTTWALLRTEFPEVVVLSHRELDPTVRVIARARIVP